MEVILREIVLSSPHRSTSPACAVPAVTLPEAVRQALIQSNLLSAQQCALQAAAAGQEAAVSRYLPRRTFEVAFAAATPPPAPS